MKPRVDRYTTRKRCVFQGLGTGLLSSVLPARLRPLPRLQMLLTSLLLRNLVNRRRNTLNATTTMTQRQKGSVSLRRRTTTRGLYKILVSQETRPFFLNRRVTETRQPTMNYAKRGFFRLIRRLATNRTRVSLLRPTNVNNGMKDHCLFRVVLDTLQRLQDIIRYVNYTTKKTTQVTSNRQGNVTRLSHILNKRRVTLSRTQTTNNGNRSTIILTLPIRLDTRYNLQRAKDRGVRDVRRAI